MIYWKVVGNLGLGTNLEVDNLEARTDTGVDLEVHIDTGVDLEENIVLSGHTVLEVAPQVVMDYLEVAPQAVFEYLAAAPQMLLSYLELAD